MAASSTSGFSAAARARRITVTYEMEKVTSDSISVIVDGRTATLWYSNEDATPVTISGVTSGISITRPAKLPNRLRERTSPSARVTPRVTEPTMATAATRRLSPSEPISGSLSRKARYQRRLKPLNTVSERWELNENSATTTIGRYSRMKKTTVIAMANRG